MTDRSRPSRWSPARIRAAAWLAAITSVVGSGVALGATPLSGSDLAEPTGRREVASPRRVIERHVIRRVVIVDQAPVSAPASAPTIVVQAPVAAAAPAPAPAPAPTSTGGS